MPGEAAMMNGDDGMEEACCAPWTPGQKLFDVELLVLDEALHYFSGNKTKAALALGITVTTLRNKVRDNDCLAQYRIAPPKHRLKRPWHRE